MKAAVTNLPVFRSDGQRWWGRDLLVVVALCAGQRVEDLRAPRRLARAARARQVFCWLARRLTRLSSPQIGRLAGCDHTTVLYAVRRIDAVVAALGPAGADRPDAWALHLLASPWPRPTA